MKKLWIFIGIVALFFLTMSDNAFSKSSENKADCEAWCRGAEGQAHNPRCEFCDSNALCGRGDYSAREYDVIKSFKKGTGSWYACGLSEYATESQKNKTDCETWCNQHKPECGICLEDRNCGSWGRTVLREFKGRGDNWYACSEATGQSNKQACETWCDTHKPECKKCSKHRDCDNPLDEKMESFRGLAGDTWYACKRAESRSCTGYYEAIPIAGPPYQSPKFLAKKACQSDLSFNVCRSQLNYSLKHCMAEDWRNPSDDNKSMACNITSSVHNFPFTTLKNLKHTICRHFGIDEYMVVTIKSKIEGERGCGGESGRRFLRNSEQTLAENFQIDCSQYVTSRKNIKNLEYQKLRIPRSNK